METNNFVSLQFNSSHPRYMQIAAHIEQLVQKGKIKPGDRLPPIRSLAQLLGVNAITVVKAYERLERGSLVTKIRGSGVYVSPVISSQDVLEETYNQTTYGNRDELFQDEEIQLMHGGHIMLPPDAVNLATSTPSSDLFPVSTFRGAVNEVLDRDGGDALGYDESSGYYPLRETVSSLLERQYGIHTSPRHLQMISGAQQGIDIAAKALLRPGDYAVVEDPTYPGALAVCASRGAQVIGVPIGPGGIDLEGLESAFRRYHPKLFYCMPKYQNPSSYSYSRACIEGVLSLARQYRVCVLEDDYLSDLTYSKDPPAPSMKALDHPEDERVIYIKSFSKLLMPGLRIGFSILPPHMYQGILRAKHLTDISSSGLLQRAFDAYLRSGAWEDHLQHMKKIFHRRYDACCKALQDMLVQHGCSFTEPHGGLHFWISLPPSVSAYRLYREAASSGVICTPGNIFKAGAYLYDDRIRISIASADEHDISTGISRLAQSLRNIRGEPTALMSPLI